MVEPRTLIIWISEECILSKFKFYEKNIEYCRLLLLHWQWTVLGFFGWENFEERMTLLLGEGVEIFAAWGCSSFWCHTTHSHIQSTISLNSKEFWFFSLINLIWDFVKHKKITFQILIRHHDCKTQKKKLVWNSYFTFHECTFLNPFCISALIRVYRWKKLAAIMPWGVVWEILFDLLCTKVKFISRRHVSFFDRDSSVIPAVNFKK